MNGIKIKVENKTGNVLKLIFNDINLENYIFKIKDNLKQNNVHYKNLKQEEMKTIKF